MKLGIEKAKEIYFKRSRRANKLVKALANWDDEKTVHENANALKVHLTTADQWVNRFKLPYKTINGRIRTNREAYDLRNDAVMILRKTGWSFSDIGKALDIARQHAEQIHAKKSP